MSNLQARLFYLFSPCRVKDCISATLLHKRVRLILAAFPLIMGYTAVHGQDTTRLDTSAKENIRFSTNDTMLKKLYDRVQKIKDNDQQNTQAIQGLLQGKEIDNMTKYELVKNNIINAAQTYYLLNKKITDLKSRTTSNSLDVFITSLNNPESKELGFSFSERVVELVKTVVLQGKADKSEKGQKLLIATNSIINSPIFKSFAALTPPLGIASALLTFFQSASINNKMINQKNLAKFEKELNKYVVYYSSLNEGNQKFQYGLNFNTDQLSSLHQSMFNHLLFTASALKFPLPVRNDTVSIGETLNQFFFTFNKESVEEFFNRLERQYTTPGTNHIDYGRLLRENGNLKEVNNQLEDLVLQTKHFESLYNDYFSLTDTYYNQVINSLQIAANNGLADKNLVLQKQNEFRLLKQEAERDIRASINIEELKNNTDNIKYRYKIF
ncbi:MAG TPA: hypothetical protein VNE41_04400 [Chitinophagaceae bacterium]|nr:hypothetical protein [Chitinophagaceae bacterium]